MNFPRRDADLIALAQKIISGMDGNPDFPSPPLTPAELHDLMVTFIAKSDAQAIAQSAAQQATESKQEARSGFADGIRAMVDYAVNAVHGNDAKLAAIGWGARATPTPRIIEPPGQPRNVRVAGQAESSVTLVWEEPNDGDEAACYKAECRVLSDGSGWRLVGTAVATEVTLTNQERGKTLEYRIIAINKAGDSLPSNTVTAVL